MHILIKRRNQKTKAKTLYALAQTGQDTFAVYAENKHYDGKVRGGIRVSWGVVVPPKATHAQLTGANKMTAEEAVKLFNKKLGLGKKGITVTREDGKYQFKTNNN